MKFYRSIKNGRKFVSVGRLFLRVVVVFYVRDNCHLGNYSNCMLYFYDERWIGNFITRYPEVWSNKN